MAEIAIKDVVNLLQLVSGTLLENQQHLTALDQEIGDGDMGITMAKIAKVFGNIETEVRERNDLGKFLIASGMATNRVAASTMGTLISTAFMRAGKELRGYNDINQKQLSAALVTAVQGIQDRGQAKLGDKTIVDALHPAAVAFQEVTQDGGDMQTATRAAADAARIGRDAVTPQRSKIGRAGWVGERTEGKVDPGCDLAVIVLSAVG